jgi:hypothetical protein
VHALPLAALPLDEHRRHGHGRRRASLLVIFPGAAGAHGPDERGG